MRRAVLPALLLALNLSSAGSATYTVDPDGQGDFPTIQAAVDAAVDGDVIELSLGTFLGDGNRDIDFLGKAITIRSANGNPEKCIIDCEGSESDHHRGFWFHRGETAVSLLADVQIRNGWATSGGGILCDSASSPTLSNLALRNNTVAHQGGGLVSYGGSAPQASDCEFSLNSASFGAGAACEWAAARFENCRFIDNDSDGPGIGDSGGGLYAVGSSLTVTDCWFQGNYASDTGGGLFFSGYDGSLIVEGSGFYQNFTEGLGGGAHLTGSGSLQISYCTFAANSSIGVGGGLSTHGSISVTNCTISDNNGYEGGGIYVLWGSTSLVNTIVWDNWGGFGRDVTVDFGASASLTCCDVHPEGVMGGNVSWNEGNIAEDPRFCGDDAPDEPYALHALSPCAPGMNPECGQIGAWPVGCGQAGTEDHARWGDHATLLAVRPNPLCQATALRFQLPEMGRYVTLTIHDSAGRQVRCLVEGFRSAGDHVVSWDGTNDAGQPLPAGTYFGRLTMPTRTAIQRILLVR